MEKNNSKKSKNWKRRFNLSNSYYSFFFSFSLALLCSFLYNYVESPLKKIFPSWKASDPFLDLNCYTGVSFFFSIVLGFLSIFSLSSNQFELESSFFSKFLKSNLYCLIKIFAISSYINKNFSSQREKYYFFLISYFFYFFSNYLIETIVIEIEKKGIFNGTNLIYFFSSIQSLKSLIISLNFFEKSSNSRTIFKLGNNKKIFTSFFLFLIFEISLLMSKVRWSSPVENNNFYYPFQKYEEKPNFSLDFKLDTYSLINAEILFEIFIFLETIFTKSEKDLSFLNYSNNSKTNPLFFFIIPIFQIPYIYFVESKQLASELNKKGVYFDEVSFNKETRNFLFLKIVQTFFVKHLVLWAIIFSYKFFANANEDCFSIIFFISQLLSFLEQGNNYRKFMVFYE